MTIDLRRPGKHTSHLAVRLADGEEVQLPVTVVHKGDGPTILFTSACHGDEYEGPIALFKLVQSLTADDLLCGTVVIAPILNPPGFAQGVRRVPLDNADLNRVYPGKADGTASERIAHAVTTNLLPNCDAHFDLHSGGRDSLIVPSVMIHEINDPDRMQRTVAAMKAFNAPMGILIKEFDSEGMIDTTSERLGKLFFCAELGGVGTPTPETVAITETGIRNVLVHFAMAEGEIKTAPWRGRERSMVVEALSFDNYAMAPVGGMFEPLAELEDVVSAGQPFANIYDTADPAAPPTVCHAPADGFVFMRRGFGLVKPGDRLVIIAEHSRRW